MNEIGYFIDIERFTAWIYDNLKYVGEDENTFIRPSTCKNWLRYEKFPTDKCLEDINALINKSEEKFKKINIADLLICVNNAIDISRGVIEVLYLLRCSLMHGEVTPDNNSLEVYKYAYYVLAEVLKKMV